jgi:flagellar biosynthesis protein FlhF
MNIKRFFGKNSREALSLVRKELGEDAVILSNRSMNGGNEIMAFKEEDMHAMIASQSKPQQANEDSEPTTLLSHIHKKNRAQTSNTPTKKSESISDDANKPADGNKQAKTAKHDNAKSKVSSIQLPSDMAQSQQVSGQQMAEMLDEMREMRRVVESQLTTISWSNILQRDPIKSSILSTLLAAGFSAALSRQMTERLPTELNQEDASAWIKNTLAKNLITVEDSSAEEETEILDQGGIFALIGPTGVGKTTTMAKLAARYVMKHGTQDLGLITTDAYRVGGYEQLRIYGKILGVMVHAVKDEADLKIALSELKNKHTILIDTVGVSQRDQMVAEQISMLSNSNSPIKRLLCLNATSTGETLADVIKAYKGKGLDGCIITKLDEAATIGNALDASIREKLKLYYTTNGQRVPEDIQLANKQALIEHALELCAARNWPYQILDEELPFVLGSSMHSSNSSQFKEMTYA